MENKLRKERKHLGSWDVGQFALLSNLACNLYLTNLHFKVLFYSFGSKFISPPVIESIEIGTFIYN